jgi:hypothetical protein
LRVVVQFDKPVPAAAKAAIDLEAFTVPLKAEPFQNHSNESRSFLDAGKSDRVEARGRFRRRLIIPA